MGATHSNGEVSSDKKDLMHRISSRVESVDKNLAQLLGGVYLFNIIKGNSIYSWTMDLNQVKVYEGEPQEDPDATFTLTEHNFKQLALGKEPARQVLQAGRCSVTGDIMRAMFLEPYINLEMPLPQDIVSKKN